MQAATPLRPDALLKWPEAAAIVQQVADQIVDGWLDAVPPMAWLALNRNGSVSARPTPAAAAPRPTADGRATASALAQLFHELVGSNPVPAALETALGPSSDGTSIEAAEAFSRSMAAFVRPSSERDLGALAERLGGEDEEARLQREMAALTQHARGAEPHPPEAPPPPAPRRRRRIPWRLVIVGATALCGLLLTVAVFAW